MTSLKTMSVMGLSTNPEMSATCFAPLEEIVSKVKLMKAGGCSEASPLQGQRPAAPLAPLGAGPRVRSWSCTASRSFNELRWDKISKVSSTAPLPRSLMKTLVCLLIPDPHGLVVIGKSPRRQDKMPGNAVDVVEVQVSHHSPRATSKQDHSRSERGCAGIQDALQTSPNVPRTLDEYPMPSILGPTVSELDIFDTDVINTTCEQFLKVPCLKEVPTQGSSGHCRSFHCPLRGTSTEWPGHANGCEHLSLADPSGKMYCNKTC